MQECSALSTFHSWHRATCLASHHPCMLVRGEQPLHVRCHVLTIAPTMEIVKRCDGSATGTDDDADAAPIYPEGMAEDQE